MEAAAAQLLSLRRLRIAWHMKLMGCPVAASAGVDALEPTAPRDSVRGDEISDTPPSDEEAELGSDSEESAGDWSPPTGAAADEELDNSPPGSPTASDDLHRFTSKNTMSDVSTCPSLGVESEEVREVVELLREKKACYRRRLSHLLYSQPSETAIVLDYDDTLFPTSWVREIGLPWQTPLQEQLDACDERLRADYEQVTDLLADCEREGEALLRRCAELSAGGVFLVTLATQEWMDKTLKNFVPKMGKALDELGIPVICARDFVPRDRWPRSSASTQACKAFGDEAKRRAIVDVLGKFYDQYEGQTWKNIVSIGDSDHEREATQSAIEEYFHETVGPVSAVDGDGATSGAQCLTLTGQTSPAASTDVKFVRVRCKTITLLDNPTIEEVCAQLRLIRDWMKPLVDREMGVDIRLSESNNDCEIRSWHRDLTGLEPGEDVSWRKLAGIDA